MNGVTVLIAAYNAEAFIMKAIRSAIAQTLPPLEILVVDDASNDRTIDVVRQFALAEPRLKIIALPTNGGPSIARNAGIDAAAGDWIAILDADDRFLPDRLERMMQAALAQQSDIVFDNFCNYNLASNKVSPPALKENGSDVMDAAGFLAGARPFLDEADLGLVKPIFRKQFLQDKSLRYATDIRHGEDFLLMVNALLAGARCTVVRRPGYLYTDRSSGFSRTKINYEAVRNESRKLLTHKLIKDDKVLTGLVETRLAALDRHNAIHNHMAFRAEKNYSAVVRHGFTDPPYRRLLTENILRRLKKVIGHE